MPRYDYYCSECSGTFEKIHSYKEKVSSCELCKKEGCVQKQLATPAKVRKGLAKQNQKSGKLVVQTIEEIKQEIKNDKKKLKERKK